MTIWLLVIGLIAYGWAVRRRSRSTALLAAALGVAWLALEVLTLRTSLDRPDAAIVVLAIGSQTAVAAFLVTFGLRAVARLAPTRQ